MLHALGITHVVSVGECALVPPLNGEDGFSVPEYQVVLGNGKQSGMPGSLWWEEREGRIKVLDIKVRGRGCLFVC
jgi:dual specificity MAP kinase phosphatase